MNSFVARFGACAQILVVAGMAACAHGDEDVLDSSDNPSLPDESDDASMGTPSQTDAGSATSDGATANDANAGAKDGGMGILDGAVATADASGGGGLPASLANGLVLYVPFDDGLAVDVTMMHPPSDITPTNLAPAPDRFGHGTGATRFAASPPSLVQIGPPNQMPLGAAPRTLAIWVKPRISAPPPTTARPNSNVFVHWGIDDCTSKMFGIGNPSDQGFGWTGCIDVTSTLPIPPSVWTFSAVVYDGATTMTLVIDQQQTARSDVSLATTASPLAVGGERKNYNDGFDYYFDGDLDDLRVWNRALTAAELTALALDR